MRKAEITAQFLTQLINFLQKWLTDEEKFNIITLSIKINPLKGKVNILARQTTVSSEGLKKLKEELEYLKTTKRKEVAEAIKVARAFGDLSENSEYDEAKNEQASVEQRIAEIEAMLKNIKVINEHEIKTDVVNVGNRVKVHDETFNEEIEYTIVGSSESDPINGKVSDESPIGRALIGAEIGETVKAETPGGEIVMKVIEISK